MPSNYDSMMSKTSKKVIQPNGDPTDSKVATQSVDLGSMIFTGEKNTEYMCLKQSRNKRSFTQGSYCVADFEFLYASKVVGSLSANGVLGLAPAYGKNSFIRSFKDHGQFVGGDAIIGINYENPLDTNQMSQISFGSINYNEIQGGEDGLNYYANLAVGKWGLLMDDIYYNDHELSGNHHAMIALIDSGNTSIQMPKSMYLKVFKEMRSHEISVISQAVDGKQVLVARKPCEQLYDVLGNLQFTLQGTVITLKPRGYLYSLPMNSDCFIGIESIPDDSNQFRLGTIFLRNFYTGLDYDKNLIMLGVNAKSSGKSEVEIIGEIKNPYKVKNYSGSGMSGWFAGIYLAALFVVAIIAVYKMRQQ